MKKANFFLLLLLCMALVTTVFASSSPEAMYISRQLLSNSMFEPGYSATASTTSNVTDSQDSSLSISVSEDLSSVYLTLNENSVQSYASLTGSSECVESGNHAGYIGIYEGTLVTPTDNVT